MLGRDVRRPARSSKEELTPLRRGWCLGNEQFLRKMLGRMEGRPYDPLRAR